MNRRQMVADDTVYSFQSLSISGPSAPSNTLDAGPSMTSTQDVAAQLAGAAAVLGEDRRLEVLSSTSSMSSLHMPSRDADSEEQFVTDDQVDISVDGPALGQVCVQSTVSYITLLVLQVLPEDIDDDVIQLGESSSESVFHLDRDSAEEVPVLWLNKEYNTFFNWSFI